MVMEFQCGIKFDIQVLKTQKIPDKTKNTFFFIMHMEACRLSCTVKFLKNKLSYLQRIDFSCLGLYTSFNYICEY